MPAPAPCLYLFVQEAYEALRIILSRLEPVVAASGGAAGAPRRAFGPLPYEEPHSVRRSVVGHARATGSCVHGGVPSVPPCHVPHSGHPEGRTGSWHLRVCPLHCCLQHTYTTYGDGVWDEQWGQATGASQYKLEPGIQAIAGGMERLITGANPDQVYPNSKNPMAVAGYVRG